MKEHYIKLCRYNNWANKLIIERINQVDNLPVEILRLMSHIVLAEKTWLDRIQGSYDNIIWKYLSLEKISGQADKNFNSWTTFLENLTEDKLESLIGYKNTKGNFYQNPVNEIITIMINHSSYHRGQINLLFRQNGYEPVIVDFIVYTRL